MSKLNIVISKLSIAYLLGLVVAIRVALLWEVHIEDIQTLCFPLVLIGVCLFIKSPRSAKFSSPVLIGIVLLWLTGTAYVRGYFSGLGGGQTVFLSRMSNDASGDRARELYRNYNVVAKQYRLPAMSILHREFEADQDAIDWIAGKDDSTIILRGDGDWVTVLFNRRVLSDVWGAGVNRLMERTPQYLKERLQNFRLEDGRDVLIIQDTVHDLPLVLSFVPESIPVACEPADLAPRYLAWLSQGLDINRLREVQSSRSLEREREAVDAALFQASEIRGYWKSHLPLALAHYLRGTRRLMRAMETFEFDGYLIESSLNHFKAALSEVHKPVNPGLYSMALNNAAVLKIVSADDEEDLARARKWLREAISTAKHPTGVPAGARAAMLNLQTFETTFGRLSPR